MRGTNSTMKSCTAPARNHPCEQPDYLCNPRAASTGPTNGLVRRKMVTEQHSFFVRRNNQPVASWRTAGHTCGSTATFCDIHHKTGKIDKIQTDATIQRRSFPDGSNPRAMPIYTVHRGIHQATSVSREAFVSYSKQFKHWQNHATGVGTVI